MIERLKRNIPRIAVGFALGAILFHFVWVSAASNNADLFAVELIGFYRIYAFVIVGSAYLALVISIGYYVGSDYLDYFGCVVTSSLLCAVYTLFWLMAPGLGALLLALPFAW